MASVTSSIRSRPSPRTRSRDRDTGGDGVRPCRPLQHQIYLQVRSEIEDGLWLDRDDFPGERDLADRYGVSVITTRAALDRLADEGWVERRRGPRYESDPSARQGRPAGGPGAAPGACAGRAGAVPLRGARVVGSDRAGRRMPRLRRAGRQRAMAVQPAPYLSRPTAQRHPQRATARGRAPPSRRRPAPPADGRAARRAGHRPPLHATPVPRRHGATVRRATDSTSRSSIPCSSPPSRCTTRRRVHRVGTDLRPSRLLGSGGDHGSRHRYLDGDSAVMLRDQ